MSRWNIIILTPWNGCFISLPITAIVYSPSRCFVACNAWHKTLFPSREGKKKTDIRPCLSLDNFSLALRASLRLFSSLFFDCNLYLLLSRAVNQQLAINMSIRSWLRQRNQTTVIKKKKFKCTGSQQAPWCFFSIFFFFYFCCSQWKETNEEDVGQHLYLQLPHFNPAR